MSTLFDLLEKIQIKPGLYLGTASITNLRMFLLGYRFARREAGITNTEAESDFYKNFQPWLQTRLSIRTVSAWDKLILLTCIDEKAAFDYFFQLLDEFLQRDKSQDIDPMLVESSSNDTEKVA
ncbi:MULTISPECIES: hypothetical protein [unclassified Coleofasciculus]|uniref:hypothetical protein n=1 Tax=unclassified Coleofasciculus TaxID=2692782 RepID=UPI00187FE699|nr:MULTISPECIES: hypothetical protein [unclassified Coleofasciculus]MBE9130109.1 hypothetical protein [Coleofasciculus sp. LEGE 07081]MBE9147103.1 hypothetical protein [Coleofasciculus sp. LEGE 07092]